MNEIASVLQHVTGYIYPNELELQWSLLIVIYPYITGLVAGAFILASLEKIFSVKELEPTYRLALIAAMAMFGFVYLWYLMLVLLLEIWFDYRADFVRWSQEGNFIQRAFYWVLSLGSRSLSKEALEVDRKAVYVITVIGGQLFSKSLRGLTVYKLQLGGQEGVLMGIGFLVLPFLILLVLIKLLPPWHESRQEVSV